MNLKQFTDLVKTERQDIMRYVFNQQKNISDLKQELEFFQDLEQCAENWLAQNRDLKDHPSMTSGLIGKLAVDYLKRAFPVVPRTVSGKTYKNLSKIFSHYAKRLFGVNDIRELKRVFQELGEHGRESVRDIYNVLDPIEEDIAIGEDVTAYLHKAVKALESGKYQGEFAIEDFMDDFSDYHWRALM